jgi:hypothetical protein
MMGVYFNDDENDVQEKKAQRRKMVRLNDRLGNDYTEIVNLGLFLVQET